MRSTSYGRYGVSAADRLILSLRARQATVHIPPEARVVADLGCGFHAHLLHSLRAAGRIDKGIGIDLDVGPPRDEALTVLTSDLNQRLPIAMASVDAALSMAVLEHLDQPERFIAEARRILRPGGRLVLTTPTPRAKPVLETIAFRLQLIDAEEIRDHKHYYTGKELRGLAASAGFHPASVSHREFSFGFNQVLLATK